LRRNGERTVHLSPRESRLRLGDVLHFGLRERSLLLFDALGCDVRGDGVLPLRRHAGDMWFGDQWKLL
jgi:hypothetical protein